MNSYVNENFSLKTFFLFWKWQVTVESKDYKHMYVELDTLCHCSFIEITL